MGKRGWQSFNAEDNTHSSPFDLLHLLWEYTVLVNSKNCASILAKTCLHLDQGRRKSHHILKRQSFAQSLLVTSPLLSKKAFVFHIFPNTPPFNPSHIPYQIFPLPLQLLLPPSTALPTASWASHQPLLLAHGLSGLFWCWWRVIWLLITPECYRHQWSLTIFSLKGGTSKIVAPYPGSLNAIQIYRPQCFLPAAFKQFSSMQLRGSNEGKSDTAEVSTPLQQTDTVIQAEFKLAKYGPSHY